MDKLTSTTVYGVTKSVTDRYMKRKGNMGAWQYLEELPNVYPLTGQQLHDIVFEAMNSDHKLSAEQFLKSKGVPI